MVTVISILSFLLSCFYLVLMGYYRWGWGKILVVFAKEKLSLTPVTIIIPARNEADAIENCLQSIYNQSYLKVSYEVIVVDDHSTDGTADVVRKFAKEKDWEALQVLELNKIPNQRYKKAAITEAIKLAKGEIIVTTDADCTMDSEWLAELVNFINHNEAVLVSGAVVFDWGKSTRNSFSNFLLHIQQLEFAGLVGIGGAALQLGIPNMCNGANLAYKKEVFEEVGGYKGNEDILSGDDMFLMHKVYERYPEQVFFLKQKEAVVKTPPSFNLSEFISQRMRWVSKSTKYTDKKITAVLATAYLYNLSIVVNFIMGFINPIFWWLALGQLAAKILTEVWFYGPVLSFFKKKKMLWLLVPAQPFHILYVLVIGILGNFGSYNWKGRTQ